LSFPAKKGVNRKLGILYKIEHPVAREWARIVKFIWYLRTNLTTNCTDFADKQVSCKKPKAQEEFEYAPGSEKARKPPRLNPLKPRNKNR
jgi:hypothetical protein